MKLVFKYDSGHGWGKVLLSELLKYNLIEKISEYSYVDDKLKYAYLEEDCDLGLYIDELKNKNINIEFDFVNDGEYSNIRNMNRFNFN